MQCAPFTCSYDSVVNYLKFGFGNGRIQQNINVGMWDGVEDIDTQVLVHLLIDWLRILQVDVLCPHV